jgi:hypothetical protein
MPPILLGKLRLAAVISKVLPLVPLLQKEEYQWVKVEGARRERKANYGVYS